MYSSFSSVEKSSVYPAAAWSLSLSEKQDINRAAVVVLYRFSVLLLQLSGGQSEYWMTTGTDGYNGCHGDEGVFIKTKILMGLSER